MVYLGNMISIINKWNRTKIFVQQICLKREIRTRNRLNKIARTKKSSTDIHKYKSHRNKVHNRNSDIALLSFKRSTYLYCQTVRIYVFLIEYGIWILISVALWSLILLSHKYKSHRNKVNNMIKYAREQFILSANELVDSLQRNDSKSYCHWFEN
jgi:hypothetical protein